MSIYVTDILKKKNNLDIQVKWICYSQIRDKYILLLQLKKNIDKETKVL